MIYYYNSFIFIIININRKYLYHSLEKQEPIIFSNRNITKKFKNNFYIIKEMQKQLLNSTIQNNKLLIEENNIEIEEISRDVKDLNLIFQDLSILILEQGEQLNTISDNIESVVENTNNANIELEKIVENKTNKKYIIFGMILGCGFGGPTGIILGGKITGLILGISGTLLGSFIGKYSNKYI